FSNFQCCQMLGTTAFNLWKKFGKHVKITLQMDPPNLSTISKQDSDAASLELRQRGEIRNQSMRLEHCITGTETKERDRNFNTRILNFNLKFRFFVNIPAMMYSSSLAAGCHLYVMKLVQMNVNAIRWSQHNELSVTAGTAGVTRPPQQRYPMALVWAEGEGHFLSDSGNLLVNSNGCLEREAG
ncbi:hypothetical protein PROFUN_16672, partial [Planoprotostelium fungivorum]